MQKTNITVAFDEAKLDALEFSLKKEHSTVQARLEQTLAQLYELSRCGSIWTAAPLPHPGPNVHPGPRRKTGPPPNCTERTAITMADRQIELWINERWYDALSGHLKKQNTTVEEKLEEYLNALIDQLSDRIGEKVSREIWEDGRRQWEAAEAARRVSVFRVTQDGETDCLLTEGAASMDDLHTAMHLRCLFSLSELFE